MTICKHCNQDYSINTPTHYRTCTEYQRFKENTKEKLTKSFLICEYIEKGKSATFIAKELGLEKKRLVIEMLQYHNIPIRSDPAVFAKQSHRQQLTKETSNEKYGVDHHLMTDAVKQKRTSTVINRYGVHNVFQAEPIKEKARRTCKERYGVEYPTQSLEIQNRVKSTFMETYGVDNPWKCDTIIQKCQDTKKQKGATSSYHSKCSQRLFWNIYDKLPPHIQSHTYFAELNTEFGKYTDTGYLFYDFVISSIKFCIEFNGTWFHADPRHYAADYYHPLIKKSAKEIWERDKQKNDILIKDGFRVEVVWQHDIEQQRDSDQNPAVARMLSLIFDLDQVRQGCL